MCWYLERQREDGIIRLSEMPENVCGWEGRVGEIRGVPFPFGQSSIRTSRFFKDYKALQDWCHIVSRTNTAATRANRYPIRQLRKQSGPP